MSGTRSQRDKDLLAERRRSQTSYGEHVRRSRRAESETGSLAVPKPTPSAASSPSAIVTLDHRQYEVPLHATDSDANMLKGSLDTVAGHLTVKVPTAVEANLQSQDDDMHPLLSRIPRNDLEAGMERDIYLNDESLKPKDDDSDSNEETGIFAFLKRNGKRILLFLAAAITSAPAGINALLSGLGITASELSVKSWNKAPVGYKILALVLMTATFILNVMLAIASLPAAFSTLFNKDTWTKTPIRTLGAFVLGLVGALSLFAVGMQSMAFSITFAVCMSSAALLINFATRLVSANSTLKRVHEQSSNEDLKLQTRYVRALKNLKPEVLQQVNQELVAESGALDKTNPRGLYARLLYKLDQKLSAKSNRENAEDLPVNLNIITEPCLQAGVEGTFEYSLGGLMLLTGYIIFELKGESALNIISHYANGSTLLENANPILRGMAGTPSGIASGLLYFLSAKDFLQVFAGAINAARQRQNAAQYVLLATLMAGIFLSGANMYKVSESVELDTNGIFAFLLQKVPTIFPWIGGLGGALVNGKAALLEFFKQQAVLEFKQGDNVVKKVAHFYEHTGIKLYQGIEDNSFPPAFLQYLREESVFARKLNLLPKEKAPDLRRIRSVYPPS